ncbi:hypothetical protein HUN39_15000 [Methylocystis sp. FS]|uniref:hypothetical protein n=1 Tax=Methylocystis silviterrae TaxID=2743612 RepID=UPI001582CBAC|nr:hypothetical protein [Methylocystis silviterrae]NUJ81314.1 hypothetical protein [Methylocystis silviterrae]
MIWPKIGAADHRYQYIERRLKNEAIDAGTTIKPYALAAIERLAARGQTVVLQMDQSHINDANEVLMLSARLRKRAVPVAWRVRSTQGNIGFAVQNELLDSMRAGLPKDVSIMLAAVRFYGTAQLIGWCQKAGWSYRIRLKGNLTLAHEGGELTTGEVAQRLPQGVTGDLTRHEHRHDREASLWRWAEVGDRALAQRGKCWTLVTPLIVIEDFEELRRSAC